MNKREQEHSQDFETEEAWSYFACASKIFGALDCPRLAALSTLGIRWLMVSLAPVSS